MSIPYSDKATDRLPDSGIFKRHTITLVAASIASGFLIGALTLVAQGALPDWLLSFSNSGAVWVIVAFVIGRFADSWQIAAVAGFLALVTELAAYYTAAHFLIQADTTLSILALWLVIATVAGPLFGAMGYFSRHLTGIKQNIAAASLGGIFVGEGLYLMTILPSLQTGFIWLGVALVITLLVARNARARLQATLFAAALGLLFFGAYYGLTLLDSLRASTVG